MILAMALACAPLTAAPITVGMSDPDGRLRENETVPTLGGCPGGGQLHDTNQIAELRVCWGTLRPARRTTRCYDQLPPHCTRRGRAGLSPG